MGHYNIQWDMVALAPIIIAILFVGDYADRRLLLKKKKKAGPADDDGIKADKKAEKLPVKASPKYRSGFRRMKSNAQRIRERAQKQAAHANSGS